MELMQCGCCKYLTLCGVLFIIVKWVYFTFITFCMIVSKLNEHCTLFIVYQLKSTEYLCIKKRQVRYNILHIVRSVLQYMLYIHSLQLGLLLLFGVDIDWVRTGISVLNHLPCSGTCLHHHGILGKCFVLLAQQTTRGPVSATAIVVAAVVVVVVGCGDRLAKRRVRGHLVRRLQQHRVERVIDRGARTTSTTAATTRASICTRGHRSDTLDNGRCAVPSSSSISRCRKECSMHFFQQLLLASGFAHMNVVGQAALRMRSVLHPARNNTFNILTITGRHIGAGAGAKSSSTCRYVTLGLDQ